MNTNHTPGPWMIYDTGDIASASVRTEDHTVIQAGNVKGATIGEAMQNARLIAAAPELLAALQDLKDAVLSHDPTGIIQERALDAARAAIATAVQS